MKKIWIIDDDEIYQFVMKINLGKINSENNIKSILSGKLFIDEIKNQENDVENCPDIIFIDINMPIMSGWDVLDIINDSNCLYLNKVQIYVCSSSIDNRDIEKAKTYTFVKNYLTKPIELEILSEITL